MHASVPLCQLSLASLRIQGSSLALPHRAIKVPGQTLTVSNAFLSKTHFLPQTSIERAGNLQKMSLPTTRSTSTGDTHNPTVSKPTSKIHLRTPPEPGKKPAQITYLIYFITGNPGLIEYYRTFLTHLYGLLSQNTASDRSIEFQVYGRSLSGFEMTSSEIKTYKYRKDPPYGLQDQIRHAEDDVVEIVEDLKDNGAKDVRVILIGHSVGAYMSLEIVRRLRAHGLAGEDFDTRIAGIVGLFPTVVDIARSETGLKAAVRSISHFPFPKSPFNHNTRST
jgi:pimeloyl-ACP methyl ester carboxylesterase